MKQKTNNKKILIFDFDGTIADTKTLWYHSMYESLKKWGYKYEDIGRMMDLGETLRETLGKLGLSFFVAWVLKRRIMKHIKNKVHDIKRCKDVDSIRKLKEKKILVTNSLKEFVIPVLKHLKLTSEFREIYGEEDFSDKAEFIANYLREKGIRKKDCFYIGDRVVDVKLAKKVGCQGVIVLGKCAWDSRNQLMDAEPDYLIEDIEKLKEILNR